MRGTLLQMSLGAAVTLTLAAASACGDGDNGSSPTTTASPSASPSPSPTRRPSPSPTESVPLSEIKLLFIRGITNDVYPLLGELWMSDLDGTNEQRISPEGVKAAAIPTRRNEGGGAVVYFITEDGETERSLVRFDVPSGARDTVFSYSDIPSMFYGDVSPNGQYFAHTQPLGLDLYRFGDHTTTTLFPSGSGAGCTGGDINECYRWLAPQWSPDNQLLLVVHSVYEGGWVEVIDPWQNPPDVLTNGSRDDPGSGAWSPDGAAVCAQGQYGNTSSLYLLESPDWEAHRVTPHYEDYTQNPDGRGVLDCGWLSNGAVIYLAIRQQRANEGELYTYDRTSGESRLVATLADGTSCCSGRLTAVEGLPVAVTQFIVPEGTRSGWTQPAAVNLETSEVDHILQPGDVVVGAFRN